MPCHVIGSSLASRLSRSPHPLPWRRRTERAHQRPRGDHPVHLARRLCGVQLRLRARRCCCAGPHADASASAPWPFSGTVTRPAPPAACPSGTSMATPFVSGAAALLLAATGGRLSAAQARAVLLETAEGLESHRGRCSSGVGPCPCWAATRSLLHACNLCLQGSVSDCKLLPPSAAAGEAEGGPRAAASARPGRAAIPAAAAAPNGTQPPSATSRDASATASTTTRPRHGTAAAIATATPQQQAAKGLPSFAQQSPATQEGEGQEEGGRVH